MSLIINSRWQSCWGTGITNDLIEMAISTAMKFPDCYKTIIADMCDFSGSWTGYDAKYIDECDKSNDATIELNTVTFRDARDHKVMTGTVFPESQMFCTQLPLTTDPWKYSNPSSVELFARSAYSTVGNYFYDRYGDKTFSGEYSKN